MNRATPTLEVETNHLFRWMTQSIRPSDLRQQLRRARRFLFLQYETALGTAVHATPMFEALRRSVPDSHIAVACSGLPSEVLKFNPHIDRILLTPHPIKNWNRALLYFLKNLRRERRDYDCILTDSGNRRGRIAFLALAAGVPLRVGFQCSHNFNHATIAYDSQKSVLENNLRLIDFFGCTQELIEPSVFFSQADSEYAGDLLRKLEYCNQKPRILLQTQTSGGEPNQWEDERFSALADGISSAAKAQVLFVGTKSESARIDAIRSRMRSPSHSLAGTTDIPVLAALLSRSDLLVTLDTGTMHVGRAMKVPMLVIAPAKNPVHEWLPPESEHIRIIIRNDIWCGGCRKLTCTTRECMKSISVDEALAAAKALLEKFPPSIAARTARVSAATVQKDDFSHARVCTGGRQTAS